MYVDLVHRCTARAIWPHHVLVCQGLGWLGHGLRNNLIVNSLLLVPTATRPSQQEPQRQTDPVKDCGGRDSKLLTVCDSWLCRPRYRASQAR